MRDGTQKLPPGSLPHRGIEQWNAQDWHSVTVKLDDGRTQTYASSTAPAVRSGERVKIVNGTVQSNR